MAFVLDLSTGNFDLRYGGVPTLTLIVYAANLFPSNAVTFRRLHDVRRSGWWSGTIIILSVISITALLIETAVREGAPSSGSVLLPSNLATLVQLGVSAFVLHQVCRVGDPNENEYGPPPTVEAAPSAAGRTGSNPAAPAAPTFLAKLSGGDPLAQIERLAKLRSDGALTDDEFAAQKAELLRRL